MRNVLLYFYFFLVQNEQLTKLAQKLIYNFNTHITTISSLITHFRLSLSVGADVNQMPFPI